MARIIDLYRAYFRQMRAVISHSAPSERVVLASLQLVPLDAGVEGTEQLPSVPASSRPPGGRTRERIT